MPNKLKDMELDSVDMCRRGANQEAFFRLFKSATPDTNIFKRIMNWLRENPDEIPEENPIGNDTYLTYTDALAKSIQSIQEDETLDDVQKAAMIQKSIGQFNAAVEKLAGVQEKSPEARPAPEFDTIQEIDSKKA